MFFKVFVLALCLPSITFAQVCDDLRTANLADALNTPPAFCGTSTDLSGQTSNHCAWEFDYRDPSALTAFSELSQRFDHCFGPHSSPDDKASVNHPDSYTLRHYEDGSFLYALSLKDKGGLQKTMIFLRHFAR
jgi:hypothetical protein